MSHLGLVIHLELIFGKSERLCLDSIFFSPVYIQLVSEPFDKKLFFALLYCLSFFVKDQLPVLMGVYVWNLYSVPLIYLSAPSATSHWFESYSFVVSLDVQQRQSSSSALLSYHADHSGPSNSPYRL